MTLDSIITGDCIEVMNGLPDSIVQTCITSPPYWGLRDYGVDRSDIMTLDSIIEREVLAV